MFVCFFFLLGPHSRKCMLKPTLEKIFPLWCHTLWVNIPVYPLPNESTLKQNIALVFAGSSNSDCWFSWDRSGNGLLILKNNKYHQVLPFWHSSIRFNKLDGCFWEEQCNGKKKQLGTFDLKTMKINVTQTVNSAASPPLNQFKKKKSSAVLHKETICRKNHSWHFSYHSIRADE